MELTIATITAFVGVLNEGTKSIAKCFGKDINRFIPIFSIVYGVILGVCGYYMTDVTIGNSLLESVIIGVSAGLASTGCHQVFHQLSKPSENETVDEKDDDDEEMEEPEAEEQTSADAITNYLIDKVANETAYDANDEYD